MTGDFALAVNVFATVFLATWEIGKPWIARGRS